MNLDEALAVYLYLHNQVPGTRDERAYKAAWAIIVHYAERTIGTGMCGTVREGEMADFRLDAYKGWTEDALRRRCRELVRVTMHRDIVIAVLAKYGPEALSIEDTKLVERICSAWED